MFFNICKKVCGIVDSLSSENVGLHLVNSYESIAYRVFNHLSTDLSTLSLKQSLEVTKHRKCLKRCKIVNLHSK